MRDWKLPWDGGCRCGKVRFRVSAEPLGRHNPFSKSSVATAPPMLAQSPNTGWRCIGFQTGRASMSFAASARRTFSRSPRATFGSIWTHVSQNIERPHGASGWNVSPASPASASR